MRFDLHAILIAVPFLLVNSSPSSPVRAQGSAASAARMPPIRQSVDAVVNKWMAREGAPGSIVVVRMGGDTQFFAYGMANQARHLAVTPDSIFELASLTKLFTATSLALEVNAGRMRLDDSVAKYIPQLAKGGDIRRVTLGELATHSSGLPRKAPSLRTGAWNEGEVLQWLIHWHAPHPPGTRYLYSNLGFQTLGQAIAVHENAPILDIWGRQLLDKLGMHHTLLDIPRDASSLVVQGYSISGQPIALNPVSGWPGAGALRSSGRDMGAFLAANMDGRADLPELTRAFRFAQQTHFEQHGLAWERRTIGGQIILDKNGGLPSTSTYIGFLPDRKIGVVIMTNRGKRHATTVGRALLMELSSHHSYRGHDEDEEGD